MKKTMISIVAVAALASSAFAASSLSSAFANGKVSGDFHARYVNGSAKTGTNLDVKNNFGYMSGTAGLYYSSASYYGLSVNTGFRGNHLFSEVDGDGDGGAYSWNKSKNMQGLMITGNVEYARKGIKVVVGRQLSDFEWATKNIEAAQVTLGLVPKTTIKVGYVQRRMPKWGTGDYLTTFNDLGASGNGMYEASVKFSPMKLFNVKAYYDYQTDTFSGYGVDANANVSMLHIKAMYAGTSEDHGKAGQFGKANNGSFYLLQASASVPIKGKYTLGAMLGYTGTGSGGAGTFGTYGDRPDPFDDGTHFYAANSSQFYGKVDATFWSTLNVYALYGQNKYDASSKGVTDNELNVGAGYTYAKHAHIDLMYAMMDTTNKDFYKDNYLYVQASYDF